MTLEIRELLNIKAAGQDYPLLRCGAGDSSIDAAWQFIDQGLLPAWGSVLMESQTSGRGRMGRVWQSPSGHIYGALRLPESSPFDTSGASLALAFLLTSALGEMGLSLKIKWPNDLIFEGGKAGGILLESKPKGLIAGIGINLMTPPCGKWVSERDRGAPEPSALPFSGSPLTLWAAIVKSIILLYNKKFGIWTMADIVSAAEELLLWRGRKVRIIKPASEPPAPPEGLAGRISGLSSEGCLCLANDSGYFKLWSGTVCLAD